MAADWPRCTLEHGVAVPESVHYTEMMAADRTDWPRCTLEHGVAVPESVHYTEMMAADRTD
ncbi:hypothetical protein DIPPA_31554 [Diplonema papillatum]|nr:hypothetical protein DIPPA_31554 [Diplonema papillatum]